MKRIATLTFQNADSYGAMLQAYALQQSIMRMGYDAELLNYSCDAIANSYRMSLTPKGVVARLCRTPYYQLRQARFDRFRNDYLRLSSEVSKNNLAIFASRYDAVIVGSDQVWNPFLTNGDDAYFLTFLNQNQRKLAYAASMGVVAWDEEQKQRYLQWLSSFDYITVREKTACDYLRSNGVAADVVCDPTLLLGMKDYLAITANSAEKEPYTLLFCLETPFAKSVNFARMLAQSRNERLVVIHNGKIPVRKAKNVRSAGPCEFLALIANASQVVTESFHGICLSISFEKEFYYFDPRKPSAAMSRSSRITDLLDGLGLSDRMVDLPINSSSQIDYSTVKKRLAKIRNASLAALNRSLEA